MPSVANSNIVSKELTPVEKFSSFANGYHGVLPIGLCRGFAGFGLFVTESKKIADMADLYEMNICPHNYNGHLSTFISMQLCAVVPNIRFAEIDVDDVPWRDELFTNLPSVENGLFILSKEAGWGTDLNEKALEKYKWLK